MSILNLIKKIDYNDIIFYFLSVSLFMMFLMPFQEYVPLNLIQQENSGAITYINDISTINRSLFIDRYAIMFWVSAGSLAMIAINNKTLSQVIVVLNSFSKTTKLALVLFFVFGVISSCLTISPVVAFRGVAFTLAMLLIAVFLAVYFKAKSQKIKHLYVIILISVIFYGAMLLMQISLSNFSIYGPYVAGNIQKILLLSYNTLNPRFLDNYFSWFIPLLLLPWVINYRPIFKLGSFVALVMLWFIMINHGWRTIYLECIVITIVLAIYDRKLLLQISKIMILAFICGYILNYIFVNYIVTVPIDNIFDKNMTRSYDRIFLIKEAFALGLKYPLTGIGQWHYLMYTKSPAGYPHNLLMEVWSQCGIPAFICFMTIVTSAIVYGFKNIKTIFSEKPYGIFLIMLIAGMVDGMLSAMFKTSLGLFGSIFVFGLCLSFYAKNIDITDASKEISKLSIFIFRLITLITILYMVITPLIWSPDWL